MTATAIRRGGYYDKYRENPTPISTRGAGVIRYIVRLLAEAGAKGGKEGPPDGVHLETLHRKLCAKFPNRDANKLWTTLRNQVPSRLRLVRGLDVQRNAKTGGYYYAGAVPDAVTARITSPKKKPAKGKKKR